MADFQVPAPELTRPAYAERLRRECAKAISSGAVDLGTGDLFDRRVDADMRTDIARLDEEAIRHTTRANRVMARHQARKDKAGANAVDIGADIVEEQAKLDILDAQLTARREQLDQPSIMGDSVTAEQAEETDRKRRTLARLRNVGDSPFAAALIWLVLIVLMGVDVPLLKAMLGQASGENPVVNWVLAAACAVVLTLIAYTAGELLLRYLDHRLRRDLWLAIVFFVVWLLGVGASAAFRVLNPIETSSSTPAVQPGPAVAGVTPPAGDSTTGAAEITLSLLLTGLLLLTGAVALGVTVLHHDPLQKQRRTSARRRVRLRWRLRLAKHAENRHDKAVDVQQSVIKDIDGLARAARDQIRWTAKGLIADVRRWMAVALGDPAATSALLAQPPARFPADSDEEIR